MDLTARGQTSRLDRNDEKTAKRSEESKLELVNHTQPEKFVLHTFRKDTHNQTSISDTYDQIWHPVFPLRRSWCVGLPECNEDTPVSMDCSATNFVSALGNHVNSESPSDISTFIDTGLMAGSRAEPHTPGQEMALFCSNVASGGEQTKMYLALWEINVVLRVELWDTGSQRRARRYMAKWQLSDGNILLAKDFWLLGVTD